MDNQYELKRRLKRWVLLPLLGFLLFFLIMALNETIGLVTWGFAVHEVLGWTMALLAVALFLGLLVYPLLSMLRFKALPDLPKDPGSSEYQAYIGSLHQRLATNPLVLTAQVAMPGADQEQELRQAYAVLNKRSTAMLKEEASRVFLSTAISQNGSLDGVFVLVSLTRMLWRIVHLYEARPSLRRIVALYSNVAGTILIARSLEDADLIEDQLEPLISSLLGGSVMTLVPGAVPLTTLVVSSITEGSVNALLTLRCGCIAQSYLCAFSVPDRKLLRRSASLEAGAMLSQVLKDNTLIIIRAVANATKNAAADITVKRLRKKPAQE